MLCKYAKVFFARSLRNVKQILCWVKLYKWSILGAIIANYNAKNSYWWDVFNLNSISTEESLVVLCNLLFRSWKNSIFLLLQVLFYLCSLMQSLEDSQAWTDLFPNSSMVSAVIVITYKLLQMESNGDPWLGEQELLLKNWLLSTVCGRYSSWTNVTEMAKWSSTGFSLQRQSLIIKASDENYKCTAIINRKILSWSRNKLISSELWCQKNEGPWRRIDSLNTALKMVKDIGNLLKCISLFSSTGLEMNFWGWLAWALTHWASKNEK